MSKGLEILYCDTELIKRHLAESLVFSAFPMSIEEENYESLSRKIDSVYYWLNHNILDIMKGLEEGKDLKELVPSEEQAKKYDLPYAIKALKRGKVLGSAKQGSGHDSYQKGVVVNAVISAPSYWYPQMQRYHFLDIISSQSKMHRITKMDLKTQCVGEVDQRAIDILNEKIDMYNKANEEGREEAFRQVVANCPMGLKLTCAITTNYLQLKGIREQRKGHKLSEWRENFMEWLDSLPYFNELLVNEK